MKQQVGVTDHDGDVAHDEKLKMFLMMVRRALLMICRWIEKNA